jgi:hypothetical protein
MSETPFVSPGSLAFDSHHKGYYTPQHTQQVAYYDVAVPQMHPSQVYYNQPNQQPVYVHQPVYIQQMPFDDYGRASMASNSINPSDSARIGVRPVAAETLDSNIATMGSVDPRWRNSALAGQDEHFSVNDPRKQSLERVVNQGNDVLRGASVFSEASSHPTFKKDNYPVFSNEIDPSQIPYEEFYTSARTLALKDSKG